jgi:hypothetical protein
MANLNLKIRDGVTGKEVEAELPDDVSIRDLLPAITNELNIAQAGNRKLINKTQNFEYNDEDNLSSRGTVENDRCLLTYEPEFGSTELVDFHFTANFIIRSYD